MGQNLTLNFGLSVILRNTYSNGFNISRANLYARVRILGEFFGNFLGILLEFSGNSYDIFGDVWLGGSDLGFFGKFLRIILES